MAKYKYPRTPHLPNSQHITEDDIVASSMWLDDEIVVVTTKMDGENTTIGQNYVHARSTDSAYHPSRGWVKNFAAEWQYKLKSDERICGENLYAKHSIHYNGLKSYFLGFSYWTEDWCHSWDETLEKFEELGIKSVPKIGVLKFGTLDIEQEIRVALDSGDEGFVIRTFDGFPYSAFHLNVAKWVRPEHVADEDGHWMGRTDFPTNKLAPPGF
jgi:hypothetical protein